MTSIGHPIVAGLPDVAADLLSFAAHLRRSPEPTDGPAFRRRVEDLFGSFETGAVRAGASAEDARLAKYALVALVDEIVLNSGWSIREGWAGNPLQLQYFNDFSAGEEFYNKLDSLRYASDPAKIAVLEVYYLSLALGFRGKYGDFQGMEKVKALTAEISRKIAEARSKDGVGLSPRGKPETGVGRIVKEFPVWVIAVGCGAVLLILYLTLKTILGVMAAGIGGEMG